MILNEPETSLHPDLLEPLARLIACAAKRSQVIVVSHAAELVAALEGRNRAAGFFWTRNWVRRWCAMGKRRPGRGPHVRKPIPGQHWKTPKITQNQARMRRRAVVAAVAFG
jgi:hypothetical protein